ncbi:MAG: sulfite exporter TauE/SafE family protein [Bacteroidetes bacterium]|nr:MAG: sulfite exporter TauE/SafE family protein [Bacteroidota bacterium]
MIFIAAFITGLLGSFHCAGMCGPIALATPTIGVSAWQRAFGKLLYNFGRIFTYAMIGALLGAFGWGMKLAGLQQSISIVAGLIMIGAVVLSSSKIKQILPTSFFFFKGDLMAKLFKQQTYTSLFAIGLLNGLLPCGFVYLGLLGAVAMQQAFDGALYMALFGLGTLPMMFSIAMSGQLLSVTVRNKINRFTPYAAVFIGCLFVLRGMGLGVPYISPKISHDQTQVKDCCKPQHTNQSITR